MKIDFVYAIGEKVKILANGAIGKVKALYFDQNNIKWFLVEYSDQNALLTEKYRLEDEIEKVD